jgi:ubiquinone/menaquinone biosynthesis C-methylase UbiE
MFSNALIKSICTKSNEENLSLDRNDWQKVLEANKAFADEDVLRRGHKLWGQYYLGSFRELQELSASGRILELCCGDGFLLSSFVGLLDFAHRGHFIDISAKQCRAFAANCHSMGLEDSRVVCGDVGQLPFPNDAFSLALGNSFLHHLPDVGTYLKEVSRVISPGGSFITFHEPTKTAPFWERFPVSLVSGRKQGSLTDIWLIRPKVIKRLLEEAGFKTVTFFPGRLLAAIFVVPWEKVFYRCGLTVPTYCLVRAYSLCKRIEGGLPLKLRLNWCPSIGVLAKK